MNQNWGDLNEKKSIICNETGIHGNIIMTGCLQLNCMVEPAYLRMTVLDKNGQIMRTEKTDLIRPNLTPLQLHNYFSLKTGESCANLKFHYIQKFSNNDEEPILCKLPLC